MQKKFYLQLLLLLIVVFTTTAGGCKRLDKYYVTPVELDAESLSVITDICERTWHYFELAIGETGIPADHLIMREDGKLHDSNYTTITNLGLYLLVIEAAVDLEYISRTEADERLNKLLVTMETMRKSNNGLFYNYFVHKEDLRPAENLYVSSVDSAWLAAGLLGISKSSNPNISLRAKRLFNNMDFSVFYDEEVGQLRLGYNDKDEEMENHHYGQIVSEARVISYLAIGKDDIPSDHWNHLYRTLPESWAWQNQKPQGRMKRIKGKELFQGFYVVNNAPIVPSWGGSMFEFLMPLLIIPEMSIAKKSFGFNNFHAVAIHKRYALEQQGYPVWGISPCAIPAGIANFKYGEFGIKKIGSKGYPDEGIITPHASALAIEIDTQGVIDNFKAFKKHYPKMWTDYGFYDSVNVKTGELAPVYLSLDQAMIFLAIHNYLTGGKTRERIYSGHIEQRIGPLLKNESFFR